MKNLSWIKMVFLAVLVIGCFISVSSKAAFADPCMPMPDLPFVKHKLSPTEKILRMQACNDIEKFKALADSLHCTEANTSDFRDAKYRQLFQPIFEDCALRNQRCDLFLRHSKKYCYYAKSIPNLKMSCDRFAEFYVSETESLAKEDASIQGYNWSLRKASYSPEELNAEFEKNKKAFENLDGTFKPVEIKRAEAYIIQLFLKLVDEQNFDPQILFNIGMWERVKFLQLILPKMNCKESNENKDEEYCHSELKRNADESAKYLDSIRTDSAKYEGGFRLNPMSDESYIADKHNTIEIKKYYSYYKRDDSIILPFDSSNEREDSFSSYSQSFNNLVKSVYSTVMEYFDFDMSKVRKIYAEHDHLVTDELIQEEMSQIKPMYEKALVDCKNNDMCKAFALFETLKRREFIYTNINKNESFSSSESIMYRGSILPKNDEQYLTDTFQKWYDEIPQPLKIRFGVSTAQQLSDYKTKYLDGIWNNPENIVTVPNAAMSDATAEKLLKQYVESENPNIKVKKVVLTSKWEVDTDRFGMPYGKLADASIIIHDPLHANRYIMLDIKATLIKPYEGGAKLFPVRVQDDGDIYYRYDGGGKFGAVEIESCPSSTSINNYDNPMYYSIVKGLK